MNIMQKRSRVLALAVASVLSISASGVLAADQEVLESVTVTATRRSESIQDVPLNIAAIGNAQIREQGISNLAEVSRTVPGLFVLDQGARAANAIIVRGLNADPISGTEALSNSGGGTVATYVGEIPLYVDLRLEDMERVEVLLGPQGTLYGAGALGGAIRYLPRRPQFDATTLQLRADAYGLAQSEGYGAKGGFTFNLPLADTLALRASVDYLDDPGFIDYGFLVRDPGVSDPEPDFTNPAAVAANLRREEDVDFQKTWSGRVGLRWQPTDAIDANLTYYYQDVEVGGRTLNQRTSFGSGRYESAQRYEEPNDRRNELLALEVTADLGFAELTSASGFSEYEDRGQRDQTDLLISLGFGYEAFPTFSAFTLDTQEDETFSQEVRLISKSTGPLGWIVGGFYNKLESMGISREFTPEFSEYLVEVGAGDQVRPDDLEYFAVVDRDRRERAVYGELSYDITPRWSVTGGARWYDYDLLTLNATDLPLLETTYNGRAPDSLVLDFEPADQADSGTLFKFNSSYDFTDDVMAYVTVSEGYRIGNSNGIDLCTGQETGQAVCTTPREFEYFPDSTTNYEVGVRTQWLDRTLTFNASAYYIEWDDPQLATSTQQGAVPITINGEGARTRGVELSFEAQVSDAFSLRGSYGYANAELTKFAADLVRTISPPGAAENPDAPFAVVFVDALAGDRLPGSPEHQGSLYASYVTPMAALLPASSNWELRLNYGITAISDVLTRTGKRGGGEALPGFALHSASAVLAADTWTLSLYAKNLLNKYAEVGVRTTPFNAQAVSDENGDIVRVRSYSKDIVRPREVGLRFTYDFAL